MLLLLLLCYSQRADETQLLSPNLVDGGRSPKTS